MGEVLAGRFELLDLIGQGGMGSVWRAVDRRSGEVVAAKVLRQSDAADLIRFVREGALRVQHPHVVTPLGWAGEDDRVVFAMPIVDGGSVRTLIGDYGALPPLLVAELARQLCDALETVHRSGIVHRDIKPANLLLRATGLGRPWLMLTDFGIAAEVDGPRLTRASMVLGTPGYLAPEQISGSDPETSQDMYAVGTVLREMLTGERPTTRGAGSPGVAPPGVPAQLWSLVDDLTRADPEARPTAAEAGDRLAAPELAWRAGALGEVEVFRHIESAGDGSATGSAPGSDPGQVPDPGDVPTRVRPDRTPLLPGEAGSHPDTAATHQRSATAGQPEGTAGTHSDRLVPLVLAGLFVLGITMALLAWRPWSGGDDGGSSPTSVSPSTPSAPVTTTTSASAATATSAGSITSPPTGTGPSTGSSTAPATRQTGSVGTVGTGIVVLRVGQPCAASQSGIEETTVGGTPVVCRSTSGGYAWQER
ncbi:protein kinase domain-containing protein [Actinomycetota bacterium]